jgi:putative ABC transport system permease protein
VVARLIVLEAMAIASLGSLAGFLVYGAIFATTATLLRAQTGVVLDLRAAHPIMLWAPLALIGLAALAGLVPALKAYRTDVATNLVPGQEN